MGKTACKKKNFEDSKHPDYECKRCGAKVRKEEKVCRPKKIKS
jgi:DNA-directed RNA polymerase subunit RPC12/RpoP